MTHGTSPVIVETRSIQDYAAAVALRIGVRDHPSWVPVLGQAGRSLPDPLGQLSVDTATAAERCYSTRDWVRLQDEWKALASTPQANPLQWYLSARAPTDPNLDDGDGGGIVAAVGDLRWSLPAMLHAALTQRPYVWYPQMAQLEEAMADNTGHITICTPLSELSPEVITRLAERRSFRVSGSRLRNVAYEATTTSFLTARTLWILSCVVAKHDIYRRHPLQRTVWLFMVPVRSDSIGPEVGLLAGHDASLEQLRMHGDADVTMIYGHSRENIFYLRDGHLCGASSDSSQIMDSHHLPACVTDGRCIRDGEVLPVRQLSSKVLCASGCSLVRLGNSFFPDEFQVGLSFLEGAGNLVVGSLRTNHARYVEQVFLYHLLRSGLSVVEAVRILNNSLPASGAETPNYIVLGEGEWTLFTPSSDSYDLAVEGQPGDWTVVMRDVDAQLVEFSVPDESGELWVTIDGAVDREVFYAVVPELDGRCRVFLFGWDRLAADRMIVHVRGEQPALAQLHSMQGALQSSAYDRVYRSYVPKLKNLTDELHALARHVCRQQTEARFSLSAGARLVEKSIQAQALVHQMDQLLCAALLGKSETTRFVLTPDVFMEADGSFSTEEFLHPSNCPHCGSELLRRIVRHQLARHTSREICICVRCGNIADVPTGGITLRLVGSDSMARGSRHHQSVVVGNPGDRSRQGWLGLRVQEGRPKGVTVEPDIVAVRVEANSSTTVPFTIEVAPRMPAHAEFVKAYFVGDLAISYGHRVMWTSRGRTEGAAGLSGIGSNE